MQFPTSKWAGLVLATLAIYGASAYAAGPSKPEGKPESNTLRQIEEMERQLAVAEMESKLRTTMGKGSPGSGAGAVGIPSLDSVLGKPTKSEEYGVVSIVIVKGKRVAELVRDDDRRLVSEGDVVDAVRVESISLDGVTVAAVKPTGKKPVSWKLPAANTAQSVAMKDAAAPSGSTTLGQPTPASSALQLPRPGQIPQVPQMQPPVPPIPMPPRP